MSVADREPVALAGAVQGLLAAAASVLIAADVWHPSDELMAALAALYAALVAALTAFARAKAWAPATVARLQANGDQAVVGALDQRDQALKLLEQHTAVLEQITKAPPAPFSPPSRLVEAIAAPPPPAPRYATVGEHRAARKAGLL